MYNILEHKQAIAENIQKAFGETPEDIEKAKWQIGEIRVDSRGIAHECYEYTAEGKPRLRRVRKNKGASTTSTGDNGEKKQVNESGQKNEDLFRIGELKNGFKFKKNTEYVFRYNKYEKQYEVFENKTQRGVGKVPMWVLKSDNGDEKFGEKVLKVVQKNYSREGSTISFGNKIYPLSLNDKKEDKVEENKKDNNASKKKNDDKKEFKLKTVHKDFTDSFDALDWLENEIGPGEYGIATITVQGMVGNLTFGYDTITASRKNDKNDTKELYVHATHLKGHFLNVTDDYESMPKGEFCDMVNRIIEENGDEA